jgi:hypothetical protein
MNVAREKCFDRVFRVLTAPTGESKHLFRRNGAVQARQLLAPVLVLQA